MFDEDRVKDEYPDGVCPDCGENIPDDAQEGEQCGNCGHVFFYIRDDNFYISEDELEQLPIDLYEDEED